MSNAEGKDDKQPGKDEVSPTASFDGSAARPGGQIGPSRIERELGRGQ